MPEQPIVDFNIGLSDQEKQDLEKLINEFQTERIQTERTGNTVEIQEQIDTINKRLAYLTSMFLTLDRRIKPLYETIRLTHQRSEILSKRISILMESIRTGEPF